MIGIIGKTHGVKESIRPKTKKVAKITKKLLDFIVSAIRSVFDLFCVVSCSVLGEFLADNFAVSTESVKVLSIGS